MRKILPEKGVNRMADNTPNNPQLINASDLRPFYVAQPDARFGTAFLSNDLRDYAVNGESIMDKSSGEIFTRRPADGRVVSFFQNKKYLDELMFELRVLISSHENFRFPKETREGAYLTSTNYDLICINDNVVRNVLEENTIIPNDDGTQDYHKLRFKLSKDSNGFFARVTSRDCDKPIISLLSTEYNRLIKSYDGEDPEYVAEKNKFENLEFWEDSDCTIHYSATVYSGEENRTFSFVANVRANEESCVILPMLTINEYFDLYDYIDITIEKITYDKWQFMYNHLSSIGGDFPSEFNRMIYPDRRILINYLNVITFVNRSTDIVLNGNEFIVAMMDVPQAHRIMKKLSTFKNSASFYLSEHRPEDPFWDVNAIWAEWLRTVGEGSASQRHHSDISFDELEEYLAGNNKVVHAHLTQDETDTEGYLVRTSRNYSYSDSEVEALIERLKLNALNGVKKIVSDTDADVTDNGLVLETVD